jgi:PAS domain S-box-containing protein
MKKNRAHHDQILPGSRPAPEKCYVPKVCFQEMVGQLNEIVFMLNNNGGLVYLNPAWQHRTGFVVEESLGQPIRDFIHPDDVSRCADYFQSTANHCCFEARFLAKDGQDLWFEVSIKPVVAGQKVTGRMGTLVDVTGRVNAAKALKASQERFSLAATASNDGIWDWNLLTDEVYFSPRWKEMLGYTDDELENCYATWYDRIHPDDLEETIASLMACLGGKNNLYESVHRLKNKDGGWSWILDRGVVMRDASGRGLRMAGSHADITKLKRVEEELLARQGELKTIFSMSPDGIVTFTPSGNISSVSPSFLSMTGFTAEELIDLPEAAFVAKMVSISAPGSSCAINSNGPFSLVHILPCQDRPESVLASPHGLADSLTRILSVTVCQLAHETISKVMYFRDVTLETHVDRMKSDFLSTAAHELRTPMSSVYGFTELLLNREFDKATTQEVLRNIHHQAASLVTMINDLLDLAKIEAGTGKAFNFVEQPLETIVKKAVGEFRVAGDDRDIRVDIAHEGYWASVDADQVKRALTNIISNAFKYSPHGGEVTVSLHRRTADTGEGQVGVRVKDQGMGMTAEQVSHIYERFWRGANTQHITGTGLGMSLVKEIMNFHKGTIEIISAPQQGTEIGLWFKSV